MILIADSGSTKTHWCVLDGAEILKEVFTKGINPFYQTDLEISEEIKSYLVPEIENFTIDRIYFYGAGCAFPEKKVIVSGALFLHFKNAVIEIESDLLGAARSLFQNNKGIACILGTGSNSCYYDGCSIVENVSPLGYILGDEGSGAVLGKLLVGDCLKNQLPKDLRDKLLAQYQLTPAIILDNVYKQPFPNRFLAKLAPFLLQNIEEPSILNIVSGSFDAFFMRNIMQYKIENNKVGFVGSVAHYFSEVLECVATKHAISISEIVQSPMAGLVKYHFCC